MEVYIDFLDATIEVSETGRFELPKYEYSIADLKRIIREVKNKISEVRAKEALDDF